jgi:hypothetical protein
MKRYNDLRRVNLLCQMFSEIKQEREQIDIQKGHAFLKCAKNMRKSSSIEQYDAASNMMANYFKLYGTNDYLLNIKAKTAKRLIIADFI